jgi:lysophospholipid acyltransferase
VRIFDIEFSYKIKDFFDAWNISVHKWLKYYVFLRMVKRGKGLSLATILTTFAVSAVWHGFYPGYFYFFLCSGINDYLFKVGAKIYILCEWIPGPVQKFLL